MGESGQLRRDVDQLVLLMGMLGRRRRSEKDGEPDSRRISVVVEVVGEDVLNDVDEVPAGWNLTGATDGEGVGKVGWQVRKEGDMFRIDDDVTVVDAIDVAVLQRPVMIIKMDAGKGEIRVVEADGGEETGYCRGEVGIAKGFVAEDDPRS